MDCKFCEDYEFQKKDSRRFKNLYGINTYLKVCLVAERFKNRIRRSRSTGLRCELNFCPTCGKRLRKEKKKL